MRSWSSPVTSKELRFVLKRFRGFHNLHSSHSSEIKVIEMPLQSKLHNLWTVQWLCMILILGALCIISGLYSPLRSIVCYWVAPPRCGQSRESNSNLSKIDETWSKEPTLISSMKQLFFVSGIQILSNLLVYCLRKQA